MKVLASTDTCHAQFTSTEAFRAASVLLAIRVAAAFWASVSAMWLRLSTTENCTHPQAGRQAAGEEGGLGMPCFMGDAYQFVVGR